MLLAEMPRRLKPVSAKTQFNIRLDETLIDDLDRWVDELNEGRTLPIDRSKLIRGVLTWAAKERPEWEGVKVGAKARR